jgi:hypothetical protein
LTSPSALVIVSARSAWVAFRSDRSRPLAFLALLQAGRYDDRGLTLIRSWPVPRGDARTSPRREEATLGLGLVHGLPPRTQHARDQAFIGLGRIFRCLSPISPRPRYPVLALRPSSEAIAGLQHAWRKPRWTLACFPTSLHAPITPRASYCGPWPALASLRTGWTRPPRRFPWLWPVSRGDCRTSARLEEATLDLGPFPDLPSRTQHAGLKPVSALACCCLPSRGRRCGPWQSIRTSHISCGPRWHASLPAHLQGT